MRLRLLRSCVDDDKDDDDDDDDDSKHILLTVVLLDGIGLSCCARLTVLTKGEGQVEISTDRSTKEVEGVGLFFGRFKVLMED